MPLQPYEQPKAFAKGHMLSGTCTILPKGFLCHQKLSLQSLNFLSSGPFPKLEQNVGINWKNFKVATVKAKKGRLNPFFFYSCWYFYRLKSLPVMTINITKVAKTFCCSSICSIKTKRPNLLNLFLFGLSFS